MVTTTTFAAPESFVRSLRLPAIAALCALALAGCESGASIFASGGSEPETQVTQPAQAAQPVVTQPRVALAPVIGAPDSVAKQMFQDMTSAVGQQKATVVGATDKAEHTLRGYVVAAKDRTGVKVSYIWDVTDPQGRRTNRITGEEFVANGNPKDPWSAVTPQISQQIAQKSAASFGSWLGAQPAPQPDPAVASATPTAPAAAAAASARPAQTAAVTPPPSQAGAPPSTPTTASIDRPTSTVVTALSGAPGDGNTSLANALKGELGKNGIPLTSNTASAYRVEGVVVVGAAANGTQPIQIDWNVKDPQGKRLGTVTQKNEIPQGSLDGSWGKTADAAAQAAAQGIIKLLPKSTGGTASN